MGQVDIMNTNNEKTKEEKTMKRKFVALMLSIMILSSYIPMFCGLEVEAAEVETVQKAKASATTVWEYNYTGAGQNFQAPYKGVYKIEAYGAQGGTATRYRFTRR